MNKTASTSWSDQTTGTTVSDLYHMMSNVTDYMASNVTDHMASNVTVHMKENVTDWNTNNVTTIGDIYNVTTNVTDYPTSNGTVEDPFSVLDMASGYRTLIEVESAILFIIMIIGGIGNFAVIAIPIRYKNFRKTFYMLLVHLAVADLLICAIGIPFQAAAILENRWTGGSGMCYITAFIRNQCEGITVLGNVAIAVNRCGSCFPHSKVGNVLKSKYTALAMVIGISIYTFLLNNLALFTGWVLLDYIPIFGICGFSELTDFSVLVIFTTLIPTFLVIVPLAIIILLYALIIYAIKFRKTGSTAPSELRQKENIRAVKVISLMYVAFLFCWIPISVIQLFDPTLENISIHGLRLMGFSFSLNSAVNPIIYVFTIKNFKEACTNLFCPFAIRIHPENNVNLSATEQTTTEPRGQKSSSS